MPPESAGNFDVKVRIHAITDEMVLRAAQFDHRESVSYGGPVEAWGDLTGPEQRDYLDHARRMLVAALKPAGKDGR